MVKKTPNFFSMHSNLFDVIGATKFYNIITDPTVQQFLSKVAKGELEREAAKEELILALVAEKNTLHQAVGSFKAFLVSIASIMARYSPSHIEPKFNQELNDAIIKATEDLKKIRS